jgi:hypothetical protein
MAVVYTKQDQGITFYMCDSAPTHSANLSDQAIDNSTGKNYYYDGVSWKTISTDALSDVLTEGNTTGTNNISVNNNQKIFSNYILSANDIEHRVGFGETIGNLRLLTINNTSGDEAYIDISGNGTVSIQADNGTTITGGLNINSVPSGTPVNNLGIDASGNVIIGTTTNLIPDNTSLDTFRGRTFRVDNTTVDTYGGIDTLNNASTIAQILGSTSFYQRFTRLRYYASIVATGRQTDIRGIDLQWYRSSGFRFVTTFRVADTAISSNPQQFYGLAGYTTQLPYGTVSLIQLSTLVNLIGVGSEAIDTNLQVFHNDGSGTCTKIDLGVGFPANRPTGDLMTTMYSIEIYNGSLETDVKYRVKNLETGEIAQGTITTDLPATTQGLAIFASRCMGTAITNTGQFELNRWGCYDVMY